MTPHLEQRLIEIAQREGYGAEIQHAMRLAAEAAAAWHSPDVLPNVNRGDSGFFCVAVMRGNGKTYTFPAVFLNEMELCWEDDSNDVVSGNRWSVEPSEDVGIASGWFDFKTHADYDDYYRALLDATDELIAWAELPLFSGQVKGAAQ